MNASSLVIVFALLAGCAEAGPKPAVLKGTLTIGPLSPVQRQGEKEVIPPEMFSHYVVIISNGDGTKEIKRLKLSRTGTFLVALPPGTYTVKAEQPGNNLKMAQEGSKVTLASGKSTTVKLKYDTGIR